MSRRSNRKIINVSYAELAGNEQPEPSIRSRGKNVSNDPPREKGTKAVEGGGTADSAPPITDSTEAQRDEGTETNSIPQVVPNASTQTKQVRQATTREANVRARPSPAYFPDPAVRLVSGYATRGLFAEQILVQESGKRDTTNTRTARDHLGMNVGAGPLLEACEDLGWFKEAKEGRPVVYQGVHIKSTDCETIESSDAASYFNGGIELIQCLMGPFGHQQTVELKLFETQKLDSFWPSSRALAFNSGNPVWGLDWCPISEKFTAEHNYAQYLAVSTIPSNNSGDSPPNLRESTIQIWCFGPNKTPTDKTDQGTASCVLVLCLDDVPPARLLKWCPLPTNDENEVGDTIRKLGILAGVFGDGAVRIYAVPDPAGYEADNEPAYVRLTRPLVHLALPDARFTYLDWGNSEVLAMGCSNGHIAVYNLKSAIQETPDPHGLSVLPTHYIHVHQSRVQSVKWIRLPGEPGQDPHMIVSGGFDGHIYVTDLRHPGGMPVSMYRCRDVIQAVAFSTYGAGIISNEHENMVKFTGLHPFVLGRGHNVTECRGPIWDIATSDLHPQVAVASSDGTLTIANLLKYARKGSAMPSFIHTVYRMDLNRHTGELRMLDMLVPRDHKDYRHLSKTRGVPQGLAPADATAAQRAAAERERDGFGTWEPSIAIHGAAWQPSRLAQAGVLASGTASGLVRIDVLREQVFDLKPRGEGADDDEEEDEDDELDQS
ncbi:WD domain, G-beta repeat protein [Rhizoctonia solani AG-3 Rhs1AP]|uniref:WD domain, G-beta repeat protein n=1 Tax=Rhizoctonia solani AG-3 Rhs1AP TaxID=1086054 RepID=X8JH49_9AGAM|nr:WD domain, G-beta repeat protein [Rhizoctonia solani AG-3 Rhs1AP]